MSGGLVDKVYIGLDNAPAAFDIKGRILGPNGTNLEYIRSETGVVAVLKADKFEPLHLSLHHSRSEALAGARSLALNLIETIRTELAQWSAAQAGGPPPPLNVPPPTLATTVGGPPNVPPPTSVTFSTASSLSSSQPSILPPPTVATSTPLMTVRQPTVLQLLQPQQQYVLNQENGQLIPIVQPGVQMQNNFTSLPIAQPLGLQQHNFGTQLVDISNMQPMNVTQLRFSGVPSSMSMILPNGLSFPQAQLSTSDSTTVSSATSTPVVCAAPSNSAHKILYSTDKDNGTVQWTVPGSQTMLIPYQQLQDLANQNALGNIQQQQFVSLGSAGGALPLSAAQLQQLQGGGTIMHLNQKPIVSSGSLINIISTGQASSPQVLSSSSNVTKHVTGQESRGQKRLSDGTPNQLQLRPIAPAGSHVTQDKSATRDSRSWTTTTGRETTAVSMGMKINPAHGTIIHVSSGQQTNVSGTGAQEPTGMYIRQNTIQVQTNKDGQKQELGKLQSGQNVQMITVPQGMVLQNPLNIGQVPVLGQPNSQVYMIPANHPNLVQGGLPPGIISQQVLQPGQNVTVMQPNQLGMQYNVPIMNMPMNMQPGTQYMPAGINLNTPISAQQLNALAGQQLTAANIGNLPIVQAPPPTQIPITQPPPQVVPQNFIPPSITPTTQYGNMPPQYMMQTNPGSVPTNAPNPYNMPTNQPANPPSNNNGQSNNTVSDNESSNGNNQTSYNMNTSSQDNGFNQSPAQSFPSEGNTTQTQNFNQNPAPPSTQSSYSTNNNGGTQSYSHTTSHPAVPYNPTNGSNQSSNQNYTPPATQSSSYSPSSTPAPNYTSSNLPNMQYPPSSQNPYPNATGQNLAAYANNQYQYTSRPWFRAPRFGGPGAQGPFPPPPPPAGPPLPVPPPSGNYNYWQDS